MDDVDAFLASLDRFTSPTIDAGIERQQQQQQSVTAQNVTSAPRQGSNSVGGASRPSRRRQRDEDSTRGNAASQRPRTTSDTALQAHAAVDVDSPAHSPYTASPYPSMHVWWCARCSAENSDHMQSCAICHRRRQRVEGPRPTFATAQASQTASLVRSTPQEPSTALENNGNMCAVGREPAVVAAPGEVSCPRCTFLNPSSHRTCEMCDGPLPPAPSPPLLSSSATTTATAPAIVERGGLPRTSQVSTLLSSSAAAVVAPSAAALASVPSVVLSGPGGGVGVREEKRSSTSATTSPPPQAPPMIVGASRIGSHMGAAPTTLAANVDAPNQMRPHVLREAARETLSLSPVALDQSNTSVVHNALRNNSEGGSDVSSSDSEEDASSDASDHDSDWDGQQKSQRDALDHRELVRFLETLQSVQFDKLPLAAVPASMRARAELQPFQLQALYWLLSREQPQPQLQQPPQTLPQQQQDDERSVFVDGVSGPMLTAKANNCGIVAGRFTRGAKDSRDWPALSNGGVDSPTSPSSSSSSSRDDSRTVRGGVFADFMGLGKTRTLVALCETARAPRVDRVTGSLVESAATLIVCPTSLLTQWVEEIRRCVERPAAAPLGILVYHGARKRRQTLFQVAQSYDYVITTYQTLTHEQPPLTQGQLSSSSGNGGNASFGAHRYGDYAEELSADDEEVSYDVDRHLQTEVGKLFMIRWARIILDEAHYIRNMHTRQSRACLRLSGVCRWAVTATPVQNSLNDLYPLLRFLEVPHFSSLQWWNNEIVRYFNQDPRHRRPVTALSILFRSILLRRTPDSLVDGKPILDLPPKRVTTYTVALSREEMQFYKAIHTRATEKLNALRQRDALAMSSPLTTFTTAFEMLVRCRQTCLHPYIVVAALRQCRRLPGGAESSDDNAALSMPDQREAERQTACALDQFVQDVVLRRLLRTIKASEFVQALVREIRQQQLELRECIICLDTVNRPAILPCAHVFCEECITHALEATRRCPLCKRNSRASEVLLVPVELLDRAHHPHTSGSTATSAAGGQGKAKDAVAGAVEPPPQVPADLDLTDVANWGLQLSSKTQYLINTVARLPREDKVVVFSSFVTYLRYAQHWLEQNGISCAIYNGSLTMAQKQRVLDTFRDAAQSDSPRVLLATTSSCGVGLNLTCANHCFLMEPSWNPGTEEQALNRIHRIGQTKPVTVTKLIADGTIEQNISQLCERKRALSGYCFGDGGAGGGGGDGRLRTADLLALFAPEEEEEPSEESSDEDSDEDEEDESESC